MTKGADGTTRVISQQIGNSNKSILSSDATKTATPQKEGPQKVQIIRAPDGKITVRGLLAGQQLIQMPDGKLHVVVAGQQGIAGQLVAASAGPKPTETETFSDNTDKTTAQNKSNVESTGATQSPRNSTQTTPQAILPAGRHIVMQGGQQVMVQPTQQMVLQSPQQVVVQAGARTPLQTVLVQGQILQRPAPPPRPPAPRALTPRPRATTQQIVVNNPALVQQIAAGKIQLATVNGQQVLVRLTGVDQGQIVAHIGQSPGTGITTSVVAAPAPSPTATPVTTPAPVVRPPPAPAAPPSQPLMEDQIMEKRLLAGQPPGTVIKTVTARVINNHFCMQQFRRVFFCSFLTLKPCFSCLSINYTLE